jgi:hypothetical protein
MPVVGDRRPRSREADAPPGALGAAGDRPRGRGTAPSTHRPVEPSEPIVARGAEHLLALTTDDASRRQEQVEELHALLR